MNDKLTTTVVESLDHVTTRRAELDQAVADARGELEHLDALEQWLNAYPQLPTGGEETPANQEPEPAAASSNGRGDAPAAARTGARAPAPASPPRTVGHPASTKTTPRAQQSRLGQRDIDAKVLSAAITSNRPLAKAELADRSGIKGEPLNAAIRRLVQSGQIIATGATRSRRYNSSKDHVPHTERGRNMKVAVAASAKRLDDNVKRLGLRERVFKAIAASPRTLDEGALTTLLEAHGDDVAEACAKLKQLGKIQYAHGTGCYQRVGQAQGG